MTGGSFLTKARRRFLVALLVLALGLAPGCGISPPPDVKPAEPDTVSLNPEDWHIYYSSELPSHPSPDPSGAWSFAFPGGNGHVNYIQTPFRTTTVPHSITITFRVDSEAPEYRVMDSGDKLPATVHLFFEQQDDDLRNPAGRWWAFVSGYNLGSDDNQTMTLSVPLTPDQWSNVVGEHDADAFYAALQNVGWVGITFGGQSFWGHGVGLDGGSARYVLIDFAVN